MQTKIVQFEAIDPLALLFPGPILQKLFEAKYPHVPLTAVLEKAVTTLTKEEKELIFLRAKQFKEIGEIVEKVIK